MIIEICPKFYLSLKFSLTLNTVFKKPEFSVYFVAFDGEESGCRGSQEFIYSHLKPHLDATGGQAQGAFILDTILNYDKRPGSQSFSKVRKFSYYFLVLFAQSPLQPHLDLISPS